MPAGCGWRNRCRCDDRKHRDNKHHGHNDNGHNGNERGRRFGPTPRAFFELPCWFP